MCHVKGFDPGIVFANVWDHAIIDWVLLEEESIFSLWTASLSRVCREFVAAMYPAEVITAGNPQIYRADGIPAAKNSRFSPLRRGRQKKIFPSRGANFGEARYKFWGRTGGAQRHRGRKPGNTWADINSRFSLIQCFPIGRLPIGKK